MSVCERDPISCGVYYLKGLNQENHLLLKCVMGRYKAQAQANRRADGFGQLIWSDKMNTQILGLIPNGERFKEYILKNFPKSKIVALELPKSPTTGNRIKTYIWNIPFSDFRKHKFYDKTPARRDNPRPYDY